MRQHQPFSPNTADPPWLKTLIILFAVAMVLLIVLLPFASVIVQALSDGPGVYLTLLRSSDMKAALLLSLEIAAIAVPLNAIFGILLVWGIVHTNFPYRRLIMILLDLPFSVSPVVVGLLYIMLLGRNAPIGAWLESHGIQVIFAFPGLLLATIFVTIPFVARELLPIMDGQCRQEEEAARLLGAGWWRIFFKITLPEIKWGLFFSIVLSLARALGEYGAVAVVSGCIRGKTNTLPLHIEALFNDYELTQANAAATILALLGLISLAVRLVSRNRIKNEH